jgi:hypothetical protein
LGSATAGSNVILSPAHVRIQSNFESAPSEPRVIVGHASGRTQSYFGSCKTNFKRKKNKIRNILKYFLKNILRSYFLFFKI